MPGEPAAIPRCDVDLFTDESLDNPYPYLRSLRDAGSLVWLEAHGMYAATRYAEVRSILADDATFVSGEGVALNDVINSLGRGTTLMSDGDAHRVQRKIIGRPLTPARWPNCGPRRNPSPMRSSSSSSNGVPSTR